MSESWASPGDLSRDWDTEAIRQLLSDAFDDEQLKALCFDHFFSVHETFGPGMSKGQMIQHLLDCVVRHDQMQELLELVQDRNPAQYVRFLYNRIQTAFRAEQWQEAKRLCAEIERLRPGYQNVQELHAKAEVALAHLERLVQLHEQAQAAFQAERWEDVKQFCAEIEALEPGYQDAEQLRIQAEAAAAKEATTEKPAPETPTPPETKPLISLPPQVPKWVWALGGLVVLALVMLGAIMLWGRNELSPTPTDTVAFHLTDARVSFAITLSTGPKLEIPAGGTLDLTSGDGVLIEMSITVGQSPFPRDLTYRYFAPRGSIPEEFTGPSASYVTPEQAGPDVIAVLITDQKTGDKILRSINVIVD